MAEGASIEERRAVSLAGADVAYWLRPCERPGASTLLLLHGAASNHTRWSEFLDLTELTGVCDSLRPDLRGNGESMWRGRLDLEVWADDLRAILEQEQVSRAILVGHSLGAQLALRFATKAPALCHALVLIEPVFPKALRGGRRLMWKCQALFRLATDAIMLITRLGLRRQSFRPRDLRELDRETRRELADSEDSSKLASKYSSLRHILPYLPTANYLQELAATVAPLPRLEGISTPVLVMLATGTSIADRSVLQREIDRLPAVDVASIEADHWPLTERPVAVCREIERWLTARRLVP